MLKQWLVSSLTTDTNNSNAKFGGFGRGNWVTGASCLWSLPRPLQMINWRAGVNPTKEAGGCRSAHTDTEKPFTQESLVDLQNTAGTPFPKENILLSPITSESKCWRVDMGPRSLSMWYQPTLTYFWLTLKNPFWNSLPKGIWSPLCIYTWFHHKVAQVMFTINSDLCNTCLSQRLRLLNYSWQN